jgi:6-hydroxytryprostatin B O-methyltransferase
VLLRFGIPQRVPLSGSITGGELAAAVGLQEDILLRTMRYAISCSGLFVEDPEGAGAAGVGVFGHNAASAELARRENLCDIANISTQELSRILGGLPEALSLQQQNGHAGGVVDANGKEEGNGAAVGDAAVPPEAAFNVAFPGYRNVFEYLARNPSVSERYHKYMMGRTNTARWSTANLVGAWDWGKLAKAQTTTTIADVGGSAGQTCLALAEACPEAKFVVMDVDPVALDRGRQIVASVGNKGLAERTSFVQYDFFTPLPSNSAASVADVYIFRHIFHDWADGDVVRILRNMVSGLKDGATVLVSEGILPEPPARRANTLDERQIL